LKAFLSNIQKELVDKTYYSTRRRKSSIPKGDGKTSVLLIPTIKDRVVEGP
jgi:RNA-directed DNA polymerase